MYVRARRLACEPPIAQFVIARTAAQSSRGGSTSQRRARPLAALAPDGTRMDLQTLQDLVNSKLEAAGASECEWFDRWVPMFSPCPPAGILRFERRYLLSTVIAGRLLQASRTTLTQQTDPPTQMCTRGCLASKRKTSECSSTATRPRGAPTASGHAPCAPVPSRLLMSASAVTRYAQGLRHLTQCNSNRALCKHRRAGQLPQHWHPM
jgi:hypothetical protein